jgi:uncharacterized protein YbjT (DUF2867 family)
MAVSSAASSVGDHSAVREERPLRVALWGGTGATGGEVLRQCLAEPRIGEIVAFTRRPLSVAAHHARVTEVHVEDFLDMTPHRQALRDIDVVYWCLGVSQLTEPKAQGYRVITRDFAVAAATVLREESPNAVFQFLSGMGAARNGLSPVMWGRVKGEAEKALAGMGLRRLVVWRPTFIHAVAGREHPTRGDRMAELLHLRAIPLLANTTLNIAHAMLHATFTDDGDKTYGPWKVNQLARCYRSAVKQES